MTRPLQAGGDSRQAAASERRLFLLTLGGAGGLILAAFSLASLASIDLAQQVRWSAPGAVAGVLATAPLLAGLYMLASAKTPSLVRFRKSQIAFFADIGFTFTPARIVLIAIAAGVSEELFFRGVLQAWTAQHAPLAVALVAPNILFGALHARTVLYAVIAGGVGVYLGVVYALSGDLLAPILTHALYDLAALDYTRRAIAEMRRAE